MQFSKLLALFAASVALAAPAAEPEPGTLVARAASIAGVQACDAANTCPNSNLVCVQGSVNICVDIAATVSAIGTSTAAITASLGSNTVVIQPSNFYTLINGLCSTSGTTSTACVQSYRLLRNIPNLLNGLFGALGGVGLGGVGLGVNVHL